MHSCCIQYSLSMRLVLVHLCFMLICFCSGIFTTGAILTPTNMDNRNIAICSNFLNEDETIVEWIEYHLKIGVDLISLYHMDSHRNSSRWREVLWPYVELGIVLVHPQQVTYLGQKASAQPASLQHCFESYRKYVDWILFIDVDEFVVPKLKLFSNPLLTSLLKLYSNYSGVVIPWRSFGPSRQNNTLFVPRLHQIQYATAYDKRDGLPGNGGFSRLSGVIKLALNTKHHDSIHCNFLQNCGDTKRKNRFSHYAHNCLYSAPTPPIDENFRPVSDPWILPYNATSHSIQLNHYFARSCAYYEYRKQSKFLSISRRYGSDSKKWPDWFKLRLGLTVSNDSHVLCKSLHDFFDTLDTSIQPLVHPGEFDSEKLWAQREAKANSLSSASVPARGVCRHCNARANCIDVLESKPLCVCKPPLYGVDGRYCGRITWSKAVHVTAMQSGIRISSENHDMSYFTGIPRGAGDSVESARWRSGVNFSSYLPHDITVPLGSRLVRILVSFKPSNQSVLDAKAVVLFTSVLGTIDVVVNSIRVASRKDLNASFVWKSVFDDTGDPSLSIDLWRRSNSPSERVNAQHPIQNRIGVRMKRMTDLSKLLSPSTMVFNLDKEQVSLLEMNLTLGLVRGIPLFIPIEGIGLLV